MPLRLRRGTDAQRLGITPAEGELIYTTDTKTVYVGDGTTVGGIAVTSLAAGITGNLSGNVNLNTFAINGIGTVDVIGNISATGNITGNHLGSFFADDSTTVIDGSTGTVVGPISNSINNIKLTGGTNGQAIVTDGNGNLSFTTITGGGGSGTVNSGNANKLAYYASLGTSISELSDISWTSNTLTVSGNIEAVNITGNHKGSFFADDSTTVIDGATGTVVGPISNSINNIKLTGGMPNEVIGTDGNGNLSFINTGIVNTGFANNLAYYPSTGRSINEIPNVSWNSATNSLLVNGSIIGNHLGSFFADDSSTVIDGSTGTVVGPISNSINNVKLTGGTNGQIIGTDGNGNLSFISSFIGDIDNGYISTSTDTIDITGSTVLNFGSAANVSLSEFTIEKWNAFSPLMNLNTLSQSNLGDIVKINFKSYNGSLTSPTAPVSGSYTGAFTSLSYDPASAGFSPNAVIAFRLDNQETVTGTTHPGKIEFVTNLGSSSSPILAYMTFDARGRLAINQQNASATVDINGVMRLVKQTAAPSSPVEGMIAVADRVNWDPASVGSGNSYPVYYDGTAWIKLT